MSMSIGRMAGASEPARGRCAADRAPSSARSRRSQYHDAQEPPRGHRQMCVEACHRSVAPWRDHECEHRGVPIPLPTSAASTRHRDRPCPGPSGATRRLHPTKPCAVPGSPDTEYPDTLEPWKRSNRYALTPTANVIVGHVVDWHRPILRIAALRFTRSTQSVSENDACGMPLLRRWQCCC